jgi:hypothetical protein
VPIAGILIVTGALTATLAIGAVAPQLLLRTLLGESREEPAVALMSRHWCLLLGLVGGLLIYSAFHPEVRFAALIVGAVEKLFFGVLVFSSPLRRRPITVLAAVADAIMALLFVAIMATAPS